MAEVTFGLSLLEDVDMRNTPDWIFIDYGADRLGPSNALEQLERGHESNALEMDTQVIVFPARREGHNLQGATLWTCANCG